MTPAIQRRLCHAAGVAFLLAQVAGIAWARFVPERFFCWAPYDEHSRFEVRVAIDGRPLSPDEVSARYRYPARAWEPRSIHNIISQVRQFETTYGRDDGAEVVIEYVTNGRPKETWTWPQQ